MVGVILSQDGVNPWIETLSQGTLCRKGAARAKKTSGTISEGTAANGCRAFQDLQEHIRAITRTRPSSLLYKWRDQFDSVECEDPLEANPRNSTLRVELNRVKRLLAEKTLELDFFKGALQKVGARRL